MVEADNDYGWEEDGENDDWGIETDNQAVLECDMEM